MDSELAIWHSSEPISFHRWVDYCFAHPKPDLESAEAEQFFNLEANAIAEYMTRLFLEAATHLEEKTPDDIAKGLWFIFGHGTEHWHQVRSKQVPAGNQVRTVLALAQFYERYLEVVCDDHGTKSAQNLNDFNDLDGAVYMLWDMDCLEGAAMFPGEEHLVDPIFSVLECALRCRRVACQVSALHGLGHLHHYHASRVESLIDMFLKRQIAATPWVAEYAREARTGCIQ